MAVVVKPCGHCGQEFKTSKYTPASQKHCSASCRDKARYCGARKLAMIERATAWVQGNREQYRATARRSYQNNREARRLLTIVSGKKYRERHPDRVAAKNAARRARLIHAIPPWADLKKIQAVYAACPPGHHVDHVFPLNGENVCGLHCEANLQILSAAANLSKGNRPPPELMGLAA